jgi:flagellar motor switch/type III secretory pathway protein FliN
MPAEASAPPKGAPPARKTGQTPATAKAVPGETAKAEPAAAAKAAPAETALAPLSKPPVEEEQINLAGPLARLPVELDVAVPVKEFRVRNLLALEPGQVIETRWTNGRDMPLATGEVRLAWCEFEVIDAQLAVRVTQLI